MPFNKTFFRDGKSAGANRLRFPIGVRVQVPAGQRRKLLHLGLLPARFRSKLLKLYTHSHIH